MVPLLGLRSHLEATGLKSYKIVRHVALFIDLLRVSNSKSHIDPFEKDRQKSSEEVRFSLRFRCIYCSFLDATGLEHHMANVNSLSAGCAS